MPKNARRGGGIAERIAQYNPVDAYMSGDRKLHSIHAVPLRVRVGATNATNTTFSDPALAGRGTSYFVGWTLRFIANPIGTTLMTAGESAVVTAYTDAGVFTFAAMSGANFVQGDEFALIPPWQASDNWEYALRSITMAAGTTGSTAAPADHEILTVTGICRIRLLVICTISLTSGGAALISLGDETGADANNLIDQTLATNIDAPMVWSNTSPANVVQPYGNAVLDFVSNGLDIGYKIITATLTGGALDFHIWWQPLTAGSICVTAAGTGAL